ncbi:MAG: sigma-70 family RNA polymerase sigma factor [Verrucomicrobiota bacterium]
MDSKALSLRSSPTAVGSEVAEEMTSHYDDIMGFLLRRTEQRAEAEDLTQETMFRFLRWRESRVARNPKRVLFQIAQNLLVDRSRRASVREIACFEDNESEAITQISPTRELEARERLTELRGILDKMPQRAREVFVLNRIKGMKHAEISDRLGISKSTVEKHMIRALALFRAALENRD